MKLEPRFVEGEQRSVKETASMLIDLFKKNSQITMSDVRNISRRRQVTNTVFFAELEEVLRRQCIFCIHEKKTPSKRPPQVLAPADYAFLLPEERNVLLKFESEPLQEISSTLAAKMRVKSLITTRLIYGISSKGKRVLKQLKASLLKESDTAKISKRSYSPPGLLRNGVI